MRSRSDVIVAPATPRAAAERAVLRLSGASLLERAGDFLPPGLGPAPRRRAARTADWEWAPGAVVEVSLLCFPGPASATGEDVLELHLPGVAPVVDAAHERMLAGGARPAEPGEFTRRAFRHGRLDLTQAEAVLELVHARHAAAARAATAVLAGGLGTQVRGAAEALDQALVQLEAGLDFEEGDSQDLQPAEIRGALERAAAALEEGLAGEEQRRPRRQGRFRVGLCGAPNAGKTALFRALTGGAGLVSGEAGTTRDPREAAWTPPEAEEGWCLVDFPGTGGTPVDARDAAARASATEAAAAVDLWWWCVDASRAADPAEQAPPPGVPVLRVWTKADLPRDASRAVGGGSDEPAVSVHAPATWTRLARRTQSFRRAADEDLAARARVGERHCAALRAARDAVARARALHEEGGPQDLVAEELRAARRGIGELAGELTPEELLDRVFAGFCIGK